MSGWNDARLRDRQSSLLPLSIAVGLLVLTVAGVGVDPPRRLKTIEPGPVISDAALDSTDGARVIKPAETRPQPGAPPRI